MNLIKWDSLLDVDKLFEDIPALDMAGWDLATDIFQKNGNMIVVMQLPGIGADTFDISLDGHVLTVKGKRESEEEVEDKEYYRKEIHRGNFERQVELPRAEYDASGISSVSKDGTLKISIPKK